MQIFTFVSIYKACTCALPYDTPLVHQLFVYYLLFSRALYSRTALYQDQKGQRAVIKNNRH